MDGDIYGVPNQENNKQIVMSRNGLSFHHKFAISKDSTFIWTLQLNDIALIPKQYIFKEGWPKSSIFMDCVATFDVLDYHLA